MRRSYPSVLHVQGDSDIVPNIKHSSNQLLSIHVVSIRSVGQLVTVGTTHMTERLGKWKHAKLSGSGCERSQRKLTDTHRQTHTDAHAHTQTHSKETMRSAGKRLLNN